ncbi:MAG: NAD(+)/NADH kinase [Dehalococcoidia bacterium]|nr:NAD(+)/NADH kinase [Dehalococcoidia bacterium]
MAGAPVGLMANPASGKDIRRLVAHASVFDNEEKRNIIRRAILGAAAAGVTEFVYMPDPNYLVENAIDGLNVEASFEAVPTPHTASALDTERAAAQMCEAGCGCLISLGGDGTNRAIARGWQDAPLVAISTGTNNVFPVMLEGTVAGMAAGLVATGRATVDEAARAAKVIHVDIEGEAGDLALIDAVLLDERFVGSRAIWQPSKLRMAMLARAEPAAIGMSAVGGLLSPVSATDEGGLFLEVGEGGQRVLAPIGPGQFAEVSVWQLPANGQRRRRADRAVLGARRRARTGTEARTTRVATGRARRSARGGRGAHDAAWSMPGHLPARDRGRVRWRLKS